jgi:hypothetical protein
MLPVNKDELILEKVIVASDEPERIAKKVITTFYNQLYARNSRFSDIQDLSLATALRRTKFEYLEWRIRKFEEEYKSLLPAGTEYKKLVFAQKPKKGELRPSSTVRNLVDAAVENTGNA